MKGGFKRDAAMMAYLLGDRTDRKALGLRVPMRTGNSATSLQASHAAANVHGIGGAIHSLGGTLCPKGASLGPQVCSRPQ
jgi:hypothetical protein